MNPGAAVTPDVLENAEEVAVKTNEADEAEETAQMPNYAEMSLAELSQLFEKLADSDDRMAKSKEAEAIKTAFYKKLSREKSAAGLICRRFRQRKKKVPLKKRLRSLLWK